MKLRKWEWLVLLALLALFAGQALASSTLKSAAFDEEYHLAAGYAYLKTGDFRLSTSHPPLINALSALPLLGRPDVSLPLDDPTWAASDYFAFADAFMWRANEDPHSLLVAARRPTILLGALLAAIIFFWARRRAGPVAGWSALILATFDPNLLANARLVTTDLGLTAFYFAACWQVWCWLKRPSWPNLLLAGLLAGLATASKFTGLLIWPTFLALVMLYPAPDRGVRQRLVALGGMALAGYAALWAVYGFDVGPVPGSRLSLSIPAPFFSYSVWDTFRVIEEQPKTAFLLGQTSPRGWWYYFAVALAVKTPLPTLLLALAGLAVVWRREGWRRSAPLWLPPLLFLALAMTGRITIGYRHILPLAPFLTLLAAVAAGAAWDYAAAGPPGWRRLRYGLLLLLLWAAVDVLRLGPHQEAYFNILAGGPEGGGRVLVDSNLDWGQDLIFLRRLLAERGITAPYLAYFGTAPPERYGLTYRPLPSFLRFTTGPEVDAFNPYTPPAGWYAISVSSLRLGLLHQNVDLYAYFQEREPVARAGYSIYLYQVTYPAGAPQDRTVVTGASVADLRPEELGLTPGRQLIVKWAATPATTITPAAAAANRPAPSFPVGASFEDAFTLLGYNQSAGELTPGASTTLTLTWRAGPGEVAQPAPALAPPLAAFVHLTDADPAAILSQYDGWGTALTGLEEGDLIVQTITLQVPEAPVPDQYFIQVGLYSPQTNRRLRLAGGEADFVRLGPFPVTAGEG